MQNVLEHPQVPAESFLLGEKARASAMERRTEWLQNALSIALKAYATPIALLEPAVAPLPPVEASVTAAARPAQEMSRTAALNLVETFEISFPADLA